MPHINIEIKAKSKNHEKVRKILEDNNAKFIGIDHQIDTYFKTNFGRLKLREGDIENSLIYYHRKNKKGPKKSDIILFKTEKKDFRLKEILKKSLGILTTVDKRRGIYFIDNVKFNLDNVKDLGTFIEIEAISNDNKVKKDELLKQCKHYINLLDINKKDMISLSYSDMLLKK